ncbi:MAG: hypothetical protein IPL40_08100 [Proteobacteria bacterium]|nr:hypothetical protein [Pseudomonadota bacterium]
MTPLRSQPRRRSLRLGALTAALLTLFVAASVGATTSPCDPSPAPLPAPLRSARERAARIAFIRAQLKRERRRALAWALTFGGTYSALALAQLSALPWVDQRADRTILAVGAAFSVGGVLPLWLMPLTVIGDSPRLEARLAREGGEADAATLALAERALCRGARSEAFGAGIVTQLGNLLVNAGLSLWIGLQYQRWGQAGLNFGLGWAIGETQILTQPTRLVATWRRYQAADFKPAPEPVAIRWALAPLQLPSGGGLALGLAF